MAAFRRRRTSARPGVTGTARVGRHTSTLVRRLRPGDVAVIEHIDLDRLSAEALVAAQVAAVVNTGPSTTGRYPNLGPQVLAQAGVPLLDITSGDLRERVRDGERLHLDGADLYHDDVHLGTGQLLDADAVDRAMREARSGMATQLAAFTADAQEFIRRERDLLLEGEGVPQLRTKIAGRHVVVVARAYEYRKDLRGLRAYLREKRPVLVGVGAGADVLLEGGHRPDVVVGDAESLSKRALRSGAEVVLHHDHGARPIGEDRIERLGVHATTFGSSGTPEDAAMLLAYTHGAELVVSVGSHATLVEFLDRGRSTMASTFITRLCLGPRLVDAASMQYLYRSRVRTWQVLLLALLGLLAVALAVAATPVGEPWWEGLRDALAQLWERVRGQGP